MNRPARGIIFCLVLLFSYLIIPRPALGRQVIQGNLDKDGDIDIFDYNILIENFGKIK